MTVKYILTSINLQAILSARNTYFIVERDIFLSRIPYALGPGSVIEFAGGSFIGTTGTSLNLNRGKIIADPYPIFLNLEVTGFSNSRVYAEWFNENGNTAPHIYINKALRSAKGCPVVLVPKDYNLTGTIVFPQSTASTLISYGNLLIDTSGEDAEWNVNPVAIDVNTSNVRLEIKRIGVVDVKNEKEVSNISDYEGTGIRVSGEVFHVSINVHTIKFTKRGIDISPGRTKTDANVKLLSIKFQSITAVYCIYMDIFSNGIPKQNWITRSSIYGGRLIGFNGIYMKDGPDDFDNNHISEMRFTSIGFEELFGMPICLRNATRLKFENIRMAEALPKTGSWIGFENVSHVSFTINGSLDADKYVASGTCDHIIIKGPLLQNRQWGQSPFDTLAIYTAKGDVNGNNRFPQKVATCSISPLQMTTRVTEKGALQQIQPTIISPKSEKDFGCLKVLPRMLRFNINSDTRINLTGLQDYAPCISYFSVEGKANLILQSTQQGYSLPLFINSLNILQKPSSTIVMGNGLYQLMWVNHSYFESRGSITTREVKKVAYIKKLK